MIGKRQEDLSKVFDRTWKANHNNKNREKLFIDNKYENITPDESVEILHKKISDAFFGQRKANLKNIVKKWK